MNTIEYIISLLPVIFMFHDFEEIIFLNSWINKRSPYLRTHYPFIAKHILPRIENVSTRAFSIAVFEEFILLSIITYTSLYTGYYYLWLAVFMAFFIHLVIHVIQFLMVRIYIPAIITSILVLPYCIYGFIQILHSHLFTLVDIILWSFIGVVIMVVNLLLAHQLGDRIDRMMK